MKCRAEYIVQHSYTEQLLAAMLVLCEIRNSILIPEVDFPDKRSNNNLH
jgi:hypothetical protein